VYRISFELTAMPPQIPPPVRGTILGGIVREAVETVATTCSGNGTTDE
jgi:hypothetical protein